MYNCQVGACDLLYTRMNGVFSTFAKIFVRLNNYKLQNEDRILQVLSCKSVLSVVIVENLGNVHGRATKV